MDQVPDVSFMRVYMSTLLVTNKITPENRCLEDEFSFWGRLIWPIFRGGAVGRVYHILPDPAVNPDERPCHPVTLRSERDELVDRITAAGNGSLMRGWRTAGGMSGGRLRVGGWV